jgi:hypothetical protein
MNANHLGRDQKIAELAGLLPRPAERDLPGGRQELLKEHLMSELHAVSGPGASRSGRPRPRRSVRAAATVAGVAGVAAAAALVTTSLSGHAPSPRGVARPAAPVTAAHLLDQVAAAAARRPRLVVRPGQWEYMRIEIAQTRYPAAALLTHLLERRQWLSVRGWCHPGLVEEPAQGLNHVSLGNQDSHGPCQVKPGFYNPTLAWIQSLPVRPHALLRRLRALTSAWHGRAQDGQMLDAIGSLFQTSIVPPALGAALFRTAALIPGTSVAPNVVNATGRPGVAVVFTLPGATVRDEWIFAKDTLEWIGDRNVLISNDNVVAVTAVVDRAIVNRRGEVPAGG